MFDELKAALFTVEPEERVRRYTGFKDEDRYIVWAEHFQGSAVHADGRLRHQALQGSIDYFIKGGDDTAIMRMQNALDEAGIAYSFESVQYEEDTGYVHYEWNFQVAVK